MTGPDAYICDDCIELCHRILQEEAEAAQKEEAHVQQLILSKIKIKMEADLVGNKLVLCILAFTDFAPDVVRSPESIVEMFQVD
ncbi:MAG: hypothetical protein II485_04795 [Firmicutes bacterium]|nr:hypothetical protein [Bacillota bacterium]